MLLNIGHGHNAKTDLRKAFVGELKRKWFGQVAVFYLGTRIDISHCVWNNGLTVFQDIAYSYFHAKEYF